MSYIYVQEQGVSLNVDGGYIKICRKNEMMKAIPVETVEGITIIGNGHLTTPCIKTCLEKGISVNFFSKTGNYFGKLYSTKHVNIFRQKQQFKMCESMEFSLALSKKIIDAKIHNQLVILRRYARNREVNLDSIFLQIKIMKNKIKDAKSIEQVMGIEGYAARNYFKGLSLLIDEEFQFHGRSKQPPKD